MNIASTTRVAVFHGVGRPLELCEVPLPEPAAGETLVRCLACTHCGSDLHTMAGRREVPLPTILGHEMLGEIVAFGPSAPRTDFAGRPLALGSRVVWGVVAACGACFFCSHDLPQKCERGFKYGHEPLQPGKELSGGLAEHCLLRAGTAVVGIPAALPAAVAAPAGCATATVAAALDAADVIRGANCLVMGAGMLGITACAMLTARGAERVICCDLSPTRLALVETFGANACAAPEELGRVAAAATASRGVDVVLELSGAPAGFEQALAALRIGGTAVLVGNVFPTPSVPLLLEQVVRRQWSLRGIHNYGPRHLLEAVEFLNSAERFPFASLVADWIPLTAAAEIPARAERTAGLRLGVSMTENPFTT